MPAHEAVFNPGTNGDQTLTEIGIILGGSIAGHDMPPVVLVRGDPTDPNRVTSVQVFETPEIPQDQIANAIEQIRGNSGVATVRPAVYSLYEPFDVMSSNVDNLVTWPSGLSSSIRADTGAEAGQVLVPRGAGSALQQTQTTDASPVREGNNYIEFGFTPQHEPIDNFRLSYEAMLPTGTLNRNPGGGGASLACRLANMVLLSTGGWFDLPLRWTATPDVVGPTSLALGALPSYLGATGGNIANLAFPIDGNFHKITVAQVPTVAGAVVMDISVGAATERFTFNDIASIGAPRFFNMAMTIFSTVDPDPNLVQWDSLGLDWGWL